MNLSIFGMLARRYPRDCEELERALIQVTKRCTRAQLKQRLKALDDDPELQPGYWASWQLPKRLHAIKLREREVVERAWRRTYRPLHRRWSVP